MGKKWRLITPLLSFSSIISASCTNTNQTSAPSLSTQPEKTPKEDKVMQPNLDQVSQESTQTLSFEKFNNEILESAQNEHPSVFISRNASQFFISSFIAMVAQLQLIKHQTEKKPYNDIIYLIDSDVNSYAKTLKNEDQRFNFAPLLEKYGDAALKDYEQKYNLGFGKLLLLDNTKYLEDYRFTNYSIFPRKVEEFQAYLKPYLDAGVKLFDFYIPDISYTALDSKARNFMLEHANKIVILSDGNAQPYSFINNNYIKWVKNQTKHYNKEQLLQAWDSLKTDNPMKIDYHYFYPLEEKFKIYNLSGKYSNSFNQDLIKNGFDWAKINVYDYPLNYQNVTKELTQLDEQEFLNDYNKLVNLSSKKLDDLIIHGKENFSKSKKNLVFIGSSLFRQDKGGPWRIIADVQSQKELHAYFAKILELYPPEQYNYFYKLHPVYKGAQAIEYIKHFTNGHEDKAIILDPSVSWENMLALDMQGIASGDSILFNKDDFISGKAKTKLFGIQPTSTTLLATLVMLQGFFKINLEQALLFVDPNNFPISDTFNIIKRDFHYFGDQGQKANRKELYNVYKYFIDPGLFPALEKFPPMSEFLMKTRSELNQD
ncbi:MULTISPECIES: hypothetical protein [unclassified Mycoplasma]|uniref:hypothetical protein n=1 Tax=unclassified Mycoplasma TaxID=2683645 RepID=UPI00211C4EE8|nr:MULTISPECIES: hypothetical protein [unclassified Mycoplasma]UUM20098.1 hypothetical protein NPA11_01575 [Mycoplasma sp. 1578d]UUM25078.1 hypothetical protein NPA12_01550 [Mycoplasma sp. 3686d]